MNDVFHRLQELATVPDIDRTPNRPQDADTFDTVTVTGDIVEVDVFADGDVIVEVLKGGDSDFITATLDAQDLDDLISNLTDARVRLREVTGA